MTDVDRETEKRLVYVKSLYMHGHEHIPHGTEFDLMLAIHHFDNAIELLLKCIATHYDIPFTTPLRISFYQLWTRVNEKHKQAKGIELPKKTEMFQLHELRCDVQHWGYSPFALDIVNRFDVYTLDFVKALLSSVFEIEYDELSMSSLVSDTKLKELLNEAERYLLEERWKDAVNKVSIAFALAKSEARKRLRLFHPLTPSPIPDLTRIGERLDKLADVVMILALHVDYEKYIQFQEKTPVVLLTLGRKPIIQEVGELKYTGENALFCFNFVLDCIIRWRL